MPIEVSDPSAKRRRRVARERIHVVFSLDNLNVGGTELNAVRLAERIDHTRFQLSLLTFNGAGPLRKRFEELGVPIHAVELGTLRSPRAALHATRLVRWLRQVGADVLHAHDIYSSVFSVPCARIAGAKAIASRRWWDGFPGAAWQLASRLGYGMAHVTVANSRRVAERVHAVEGVARNRIRIIPNFVDELAFETPSIEQLHAWRAELGITPQAPIIGIVANLLPIKDHETLLRAFVPLLERWPSARLVLVGDGERREALSALAADLGIRASVIFTGRQPAHPSFHHLFDVSVLCSRSEGLPNSILEAMAAGKPVVATNVGGVADAVEHGVTGLLVPAGGVTQLTAALTTLLENAASRVAMGAAGRDRARRLYSSGAALEALEALYLELAGRDAARVTSAHLDPALAG